MERRQHQRKPLEGNQALDVSLFLNAHSLVHEGRSEQFELAAQAFDISSGGLGLKLNFKADLMTLKRGQEITVSFHAKSRPMSVPARIAHYEQSDGTLGICFVQPLAAVDV